MSTRLEKSHVVWRLPAEMNIYQAAQLKTELATVLSHDLPISCELDGVEEMDCSGLQLLMMAVRESTRAGHHCVIDRCSPAAHEALTVMGLHALQSAPSGGEA